MLSAQLSSIQLLRVAVQDTFNGSFVSYTERHDSTTGISISLLISPQGQGTSHRNVLGVSAGRPFLQNHCQVGFHACQLNKTVYRKNVLAVQRMISLMNKNRFHRTEYTFDVVLTSASQSDHGTSRSI